MYINHTMIYKPRGRNLKKRKAKRPKTWRRYAGKALTALSTAAVNQLKSRLGLNTELHTLDKVSTVYTGTGTLAGVAFNISPLIPIGDTTYTRTGNSIRMTRFHMRGLIQNGVSNLGVGTEARLIVVNWGSTPYVNTNVNDILTVPTDINSLYTTNPTYPHRVLFDKIYQLGIASNGAEPNQYEFNFDYTPLTHHITWTDGDTTGAVANVLRGVIGVYFMTYGSTVQPQFYPYQRISFVDN